MSQPDFKRSIRDWVKKNKVIYSDLGEIKIGSLIGEGGNALVYETTFLIDTAIKFLSEPVTASPSTRYLRFLDEYRNLLKINHTGCVVPLYHFAIVDMDGIRIPYIVMERCIRTLKKEYQDKKLIHPDDFSKLLRNLIKCIKTIHDEKIIHRDLKPENILLRSNNDWVLADFGISWFDPDLHLKVAHTERDERLANYGFSAPEQMRRQDYTSPYPSMDIYALGQILYYCISGKTIRGTGHTPIGEFAPELTRYNGMIDKMVRQVPEERFQSIAELEEFINTIEKPERDEDAIRLEELIRQQKIFDRAIRRSLPGTQIACPTLIAEKLQINRVMQALSEICEECDLWWTRGRTKLHAKPIHKISEEIWLVGYQECKVKEICIYRDNTLERQYIALHLDPLSDFGVHNLSEAADVDEAGLFQGTYIKLNEYDDGYAEIDGNIIELKKVEIRRRNLKLDFLFLVPRLSVLLQTDEDDIVQQTYNKLLQRKRLSIELLQELEHLDRPYWMSMSD